MTVLAQDLFVEGTEQMILASSLSDRQMEGLRVKKEVSVKEKSLLELEVQACKDLLAALLSC